jgi:predicted lysophospholipase L1 biosynthesis ABC-type transport system permease subunit
VIVINQALADKYFPGVDPVGQRIAAGEGWARVIGVVGNVAEADLRDEPGPARYMLYDHVSGIRQEHTLVLRMQGGRDPAAVLNAARKAVQDAAPGVAIRELTTLESVFTRAIGPARQVMSLLALLGGLALALGSIGVYGVVSHFVARRKRDWGIRIALGLHPARVVRQVVGRGGALVGAGIGVGLIGFLALARLLASFLYGVGTADPLALAGATAVLLGAGLLAAWLPARRASRIDPAIVLREQ